MSTISNAYTNGLLADAAYAGDLSDGLPESELRDRLQDSMTSPLAEFIAANFSIVTHVESGEIFASGFDATVWRRNSDGAIYVSLQGTQGLADLLVDVDLAALGAARAQFVDMVNWWLRNTTETTESARQIREIAGGPRAIPGGVEYFELSPSVAGTGKLAGIQSIAGVNGHSLGGHLASAFTRIFGGAWSIAHTDTFNSAGFTLNSENFFLNLQQLLGTGMQQYPNQLEQSNFFAKNGLNVTTNSFYFSQIGQRIPVFNEEGFGVANHSMYKLTDTLALIDTLARLDPSLSFERANHILELGGTKANSLESTLDALRRLLLDPSQSSLPLGDASGSSAARSALHEALNGLKASPSLAALSGKLNLNALSGIAAADYASLAKSDFIRFLELRLLTPFELRLAAGHEQSATQLLQSIHAGDFAPWSADRDARLYGDDGKLFDFSDRWYEDRSRMLGSLLARNEANAMEAPRRVGEPRTVYLEDVASGIALAEGDALIPNNADQTRYISFGSDASDTLVGGDLDDRLYGGAGADTLAGGKGDDRIEGGQGSDIIVGGEGIDLLEGGLGIDDLSGGDGDDTLVGGPDADQLRGGAGNDLLLGGQGNDAYYIASGEGTDTIVDSDALGRIVWDGETLGGGLRLQQDVWRSADSRFTYYLRPGEGDGTATLFITKSGASGRVQIRNFDLASEAGSPLGLTLSDEPWPGYSPATYALQGDLGVELVLDDPSGWIYPRVDQWGNYVRTDDPSPGAWDTFQDTPAADRIESGGGRDAVAAFRGGDDHIVAGPEIWDLPDPNFPWLPLSETETDEVDGGPGNDVIYGGFGIDLLFGNSGADTLLGGAGSDVLYPAANAMSIWNGYADLIAQFSPRSDYPRDGVPSEWFNAPDGGYGGVYAFSTQGIPFAELWITDGNVQFLAGTTDSEFVSGGDGHDLITSGDGPDLLLGGPGSDRIRGGGGDDLIDGGPDNDRLDGGPGNDLILGGAGRDLIRGGDGNDEIDADTGDDIIEGGPGNDTYLFDLGDGADSIIDYEGQNRIAFGAGITPQNLTAGLRADGAIRLIYASAQPVSFRMQATATRSAAATSSDEISFAVRPVEGPSAQPAVDLSFAFASGERMGLAELIAAQAAEPTTLTGTAGDDLLLDQAGDDTIDAGDGADTIYGLGGENQIFGGAGNDRVFGLLGTYVIDGGDGDDLLVGGHGDDRLLGGAGSDTLFGGAGADWLEGGADDDVLDGQAGDDDYAFGRGAGVDRIVESGAGHDRIVIGGGVAPGDIVVTASAGMLELGIAGTTDRLLVAWDAGRDFPLEQIAFADGTRWQIAATGEVIPDAGPPEPSVQTPIDMVTASEDEAFAFAIPATTFANATGAALSATHADGSPLPAWLSFNPATATFSGTPGNDDVGDIDVRVTASTANGSATEDFVLSVLNVNDAPEVAMPLADAVVDEDSPFNLTIPPSTFVDVDAGDLLTLTASADGDQPWPTWLAFDPVVRRFSGTPTNADVGSIDLRITAADKAGASTADVMRLTVLNTNDAPKLARPLPDVVAIERKLFSWALAADQFIDVDAGDKLRYDVSGANGAALPGWLTFDATTRTLSGLPGEDDVGPLLVRVTATDDAGARAAGEFVLEILPKPGIVVDGTDGADLLQGTDGADMMRGGDGNDLIRGGPGQDTLVGEAGIDILDGQSGNDTLHGGPGDDTLIGGSGADTMSGGPGNDFYGVDDIRDRIIEEPAGGTDSVASSVSLVLPAHVENLALLGSADLDGGGNALNNTMIGNSGRNRLDGGSGADIMLGGSGDDHYVVDQAADVVTELAGGGFDSIESTITLTLPSHVERLLLTGASPIGGTGNSAANLIIGNAAANALNGAGGSDVLQGLGGDDVLVDTSGRGLLDAGDGNDTLTGGTDRQFFAGGTGSDVIALGGGADVIGFNRGHGADAISAPTRGAGLNESNDTVSLGGIRATDLRLARIGNDLLIRSDAASDSLKFIDWYLVAGNRTVTSLQIVVDSTGGYDPASANPLVNRRVVRFDFTRLVSAFNAAYAADASIGEWAIPESSLVAALTGSSDTQAIGGDLAYRYAHDGGFSALDFAAANAVLGGADFATAAQPFSTAASSGGVRLFDAGPSTDDASASASRIASVPSAADGSAQTGIKAAPKEIQALADAWAASSIQDGDVASAPYLTFDAMTSALDSAARLPSPQQDLAVVGTARRRPPSADESSVELGELMARDYLRQRWQAAHAALTRIEQGTASMPGGEGHEAMSATFDLLGVREAVLMASTAARARQPSYAFAC